MAIYSRFGGEVVILGGKVGRGEVDFRDRDGEKIYHTWVNELKADQGITEINEAIRAANRAKGYPCMGFKMHFINEDDEVQYMVGFREATLDYGGSVEDESQNSGEPEHLFIDTHHFFAFPDEDSRYESEKFGIHEREAFSQRMNELGIKPDAVLRVWDAYR